MKRLILLFPVFSIVFAANAQKYMTKNGYIGFLFPYSDGGYKGR